MSASLHWSVKTSYSVHIVAIVIITYWLTVSASIENEFWGGGGANCAIAQTKPDYIIKKLIIVWVTHISGAHSDYFQKNITCKDK